MEDDLLLEKLSKLPDKLKAKVSDFIDDLLTNKSERKEEVNKPVFGSGKGMFKIMPGFDEPLEDFKEYM